MLSERGDVFYHPDIHTHDSCINEVSNCQLFILIIGGRFGGAYTSDHKKSIVNAEYSAAKEQRIPVFTFVKRNVHSDHHVYNKNKDNDSLGKIAFPSIENQDHASDIFNFVDEVRLAKVNNGIFPFDYAREIVDLLRKQWAGMFYEFLEKRSASSQLEVATNLLRNISVAGEKVEELVKSLYLHVDKAGAEAKIVSVDQKAVARSFYESIFSGFVRDVLSGGYAQKLLDLPREGKWYEYIAKATGGSVKTSPFPEGKAIVIDWKNCGKIVDYPESPDHKASRGCREQEERFAVVKKMDKAQLKEVLLELDLFTEA